MKAVTVDGRSLAERYELALAHEHVFIDIRCWLDETHAPSRHLRDRPVDGTTLAEVRGNPFACLDNLLLGAAQAQAQLGVPLYVHLHPWARRGHEALDLVVAGGGRPERVVLCHLDP